VTTIQLSPAAEAGSWLLADRSELSPELTCPAGRLIKILLITARQKIIFPGALGPPPRMDGGGDGYSVDFEPYFDVK
jgi:hypothetical protein